jgi:hypothetical protein
LFLKQGLYNCLGWPKPIASASQVAGIAGVYNYNQHGY